MKNLKRSFSVVCDGPASPSAGDLLRQGLAHHQAGRWIEAATAYERVLELNPNEADALHLLGVLSTQLGDAPKAVGLLRRAVALMPSHGAARANLGNALLACGDSDGAVAELTEAVRIEPANADSRYNLGNVLFNLGRADEALVAYLGATEANPGHLAARFNAANALAALGRNVEAVEVYRTLAGYEAQFPFLWTNLGVSHVNLGELEAAADAFREATRVQPRASQAWNNLGGILGQLDCLDEAIAALRRAIELAPDDLDTQLNLARALQRAGRDEAPIVAAKAVQKAPHSAIAWATLGDANLAFGDNDAAMRAYNRALAIDPDCLRDTNNLGLTYFRVGLVEETIAFYDEALTRRPDDADAWGDRGIAWLHAGDVPQAVADLRRSVELNPANEFAHSNLVLSHCYGHAYAGEDLLREAKAWAAVHAPEGLELPPVHVGNRDRLRIGYVSADFHAHPAGYLYEAMFPFHDRNRFETFAYSTKDYRDAVTDRIKASVDHWAVVQEEEDEEFAARVRNDGIDILVDLLGHTPGHRLKAFARRPAPVQATWLGYFGTTGMSQMDFILADQYVLPERHEGHFTERAARMPGCLYVFQPPKLPIAPNALPMAKNGHVTFGCFNNLSKITPEVVALWSEVLRARPDSRLILNRWPFRSRSVRDHYAGLFTANGVDPSRVEMRATDGREAYLRSYHDVDLMLDTFPFGGGTTTSEALWMGVPVVTLSSERFVGRMTESILHTVGLPELLPADREGFVSMALALTDDSAHLAEMREGLRAQVEGSPLCDLPRYTRDLESTFEWMWTNRA